jgi:antirestriction protein
MQARQIRFERLAAENTKIVKKHSRSGIAWQLHISEEAAAAHRAEFEATHALHARALEEHERDFEEKWDLAEANRSRFADLEEADERYRNYLEQHCSQGVLLDNTRIQVSTQCNVGSGRTGNANWN